MDRCITRPNDPHQLPKQRNWTRAARAVLPIGDFFAGWKDGRAKGIGRPIRILARALDRSRRESEGLLQEFVCN